MANYAPISQKLNAIARETERFGKPSEAIRYALARGEALVRCSTDTCTLAERLFALMILDDEHCVVATHVLGAKVTTTTV